MIWGKRKGSPVQHPCTDYVSTICNGKEIAEHVLPDWTFTEGEPFTDRRLCILCMGYYIRNYDNTLLLRWIGKTESIRYLRVVG